MTASPIRALVVEDDPSWQQILSEILTDMGLTVEIAGNLATATTFIESESHRLAIVDMSLAEADHQNSDGLRVLDAVHRSDPSCRTILLTGFATVELAVKVLTEYKAFTFLRKEDFHRAQFREVVRRALSNVPVPTSMPLETGISGLGSDQHVGAQAGLHGNKVLVVEDDAGWRNILSELLADGGHQVRLCASFGDALGCLRREKFNLAIVDLSLTNGVSWGKDPLGESEVRSPGSLEGYQLLANIKEMKIPTIVVSGIASIDQIQRAYTEHSIFAFLEKQAFDRATFQRLVREAVFTRTGTSSLDSLTTREREVFDLMAKGMTNKEIAESMVITTNTVKRHLKSIFDKLEVHTRSAAITKAFGRSLTS